MVEGYPTCPRPGKLSLVYRITTGGEERTTAPHDRRPCPNWSSVRDAPAASSSMRGNWAVVSGASAANRRLWPVSWLPSRSRPPTRFIRMRKWLRSLKPSREESSRPDTVCRSARSVVGRSGGKTSPASIVGTCSIQRMSRIAPPGGYGGMVHSDHGRVSLSCCVRRDQLDACRRVQRTA